LELENILKINKMATKLLIVESPAKAKTINQYLGSDFLVLASYGHIRDLPKTNIGIDFENNYNPKYLVPKDSKKTVKLLKKSLSGKELWLATDYDREGEAIAWHLEQILNPKGNSRRIVFTEITKRALKKAIQQPRKIDFNLVEAQQARRILDRLVGYSLSPLLWKVIARGLSAGRVQSVAVRLICERENEINKFKVEEYWDIFAKLEKENQSPLFAAKLYKFKDKKTNKIFIKSEKDANSLKSILEKEKWLVLNVEEKKENRFPAPPFITSTMQQAASTILGFGAKRTMKIAQELYEGIDLGTGKRKGLITYMRTDSVQVSKQAISQVRKVIAEKFGNKYLPKNPRFYKSKTKGAQEAHEAIRPTSPKLLPENVKGHLSYDQFKLYSIIWKRFVASQASEAQIKIITVDIKVGDYGFLAKDENAIFPGFLKIWDRKIESKNKMPNLKKGDFLILKNLDLQQKFTKPIARFTEAGLIKTLEKMGIGRPSTYAPTIDTIQKRGYIQKEGKYLLPKEIAFIVIKLLKEKFEEIVDYKFTANMEKELDKIAEGKLKRKEALDSFWFKFEKHLNKQKKNLKKEDYQEITKEKCPECGKNLVIKFGRYGKFLACSGFPECKFSKPIFEENNEKQKKEIEQIIANKKCKKCGSEMILKDGRYGKFLACKNYPKCKYTEPILEKIGQKCPECEKGDVVVKRTRKGKIFWGCSNYPKCKWASWSKPK